MYRIGQGIDFHQLAEGRELWLGGILIPHTKGAVGHSDADVLLHAICDAMLGALALGDIGKHFPDTENKYKGIDSKILLKECYELIKRKGYQLVNIDSTLLLQAPKIKPYVEQMQVAIAAIVGLTIDDVSIKATTTEHLSFIGREEGVVATANVLLQKSVLITEELPIVAVAMEPAPPTVTEEGVNTTLPQQN
ncbi:MAG: 2-C-methyl-D-erythritol 2,4-cyclodiphosphate synthase [Bacteroidetes bacterium]|nr:2-C-methyl-D-erythritol 2,4-cyclodiphosphate synthase [Bacteroidota bacterium]